jgi:hypothetical protein
MKNIPLIVALAGGLVLSGCATGKNDLSLDTVGPAPTAQARANDTTGTLIVYSAIKRNADFDTSNPYRPEHSDYQILNADHSPLRRVHNVSPSVSEDVVPVELPPGKYVVEARANGYGYLDVPVMIVAGEDTVLHLEGSGFWPNESVFNANNSVRLPDGQIVGWKSTQ